LGNNTKRSAEGFTKEQITTFRGKWFFCKDCDFDWPEHKRKLVPLAKAMEDADATSLAAVGWTCELCPRRKEVACQQLECEFPDCREQFLERLATQ